MGLLAHTQDINDNCLVFDCRFALIDKQAGQKAYSAGHIPGAIYADLEKHLSAPGGPGGRHPLPEKEQFIAQLHVWGVNSDSDIICYDQNNGAFAARLWWMLRWCGHDKVRVLDGGFDAWLAAKGEVENSEPRLPARGNFKERPCLTRTINAEDLPHHQGPVVDARDLPRYLGKEEPIDPVAGHIPGALCMPFAGNFRDGHFLSAGELAARFEETGLSTNDDIACYCGSGVTAIHNILALMIAGYPEPALYPGSWSHWITDPNRPVATDSQ